jgi:hypothetical protein
MRLSISAFLLVLMSASLSLAITTATTSFQNGIGGYTGTFDRYISDGTGDPGFTVAQTDGSALGTVILNGFNQGAGSPPTRTAATPDVQGLIRFDNIFGSNPGQIPVGAYILDAQLQLVTAGGTTSAATGQSIIGGFNGATTNTITGSVGPFGVAALKIPFNSTTDYYTSYPNSTARGPYFTENSGEYATRPVGAFGTNAVGQIGSANITNIVQQWSSGTLANNGVAVQAGIPGPIDDWHIHTTGYTTPEGRPKLSVTYTTDPITVTTFQPGVGTYADSNVTMTRVVGGTVPATTDGATITTNAGLDGLETTVNEQLALVKFSNVFGAGIGQAAADKPVAKAWLVITTASATNAQTNDPYDVDVVRQSWDTTTKYNQFGANPGLQFLDGDITPTLDRRAGASAGGEAWFDVTSYLESVRNGATDNGLSIRPRGTDGWNIFFNGASDLSVRPRLVVASQTTASTSPAGDFNNDTKVGAADYVTWRKSENTNNALANDGGLGTPVGTAHYALWRENFGNSGSPPPAPTPSLLMNYDMVNIPSALANLPASGTWDPSVQQTCGSLACQNSSQSAPGILGLPLSRGPGLAVAGLANAFSAQNWTNVTADGGTIDKARAITNGDFFQFGFTVDATHQASLSTFDTTLRRSATNGPMNFELQYSFDGFATAGVPIQLNGNSEFKYLGRVSGNAPDPNPILTDPDRYMTLDSGGRPDAGVTPGDQITTFDLSQIIGLQNLTNKTITFRLYGWGDGNAGAANSNTIALGRMSGPRFTGFVSALSGPSLANVPEPASAMLVAILAFVITGVCRRRR